MSFLDNGDIRIGVNLGLGGAITYLSEEGSTVNMINSYDLGRQIQQSYFSGPDQFLPPGRQQHPAWSPWPWNPIQTGDVFDNHGRILSHTNDASEIYLRMIPMQWALNRVRGEARFEQWIRLEGNVAHVRNRLTNARTDATEQFRARDQELPAVYTVGKFHRLFSYTGTAPFTGDALTELPKAPPPWAYFRATENWAALVDDDLRGVGIRHPDAVRFIGGYSGSNPGTGGPLDFDTGYVSPLHIELIDHDIVYEYEYQLIVGHLDEIRQWIYDNPGPDRKPHYRFASDRQHWYPHIPSGTTDAGVPDDFLRVHVDSNDPILFGPNCAFRAEEVPQLFMAARHHLADPPATPRAFLFWETDNAGAFSETRIGNVVVNPDDQWHIYNFNLSASPAWQGLISWLRLDPIQTGQAGDYVDISALSHKNDPPQITPIGDQSIPENTSGGPFPFSIDEDLLPLDALSLTASSSNTTLVPNANLTLGGSGSERSLSVTPAPDIRGTTTITITVSDGVETTAESFQLTVIDPDSDLDGDGLPYWWEALHGLDPESDDGPNGADGDLEDDGITNLLERALNLDPNVADRDGLPVVSIARNPDGRNHCIQISHRRLIDPANLTYQIEISPHLDQWDSHPPLTELVGPPVPLGDGITEIVTFRIKPTISESPQRYVRLRVETD